MTPPTELERLRAENERMRGEIERFEVGWCRACDGTGDVHSIDGNWLGACTCPAGQALNLRAENEQLKSQYHADVDGAILGKIRSDKRAEAWKAAAELADGYMDDNGYTLHEWNGFGELIKAARQLEEPSETVIPTVGTPEKP